MAKLEQLILEGRGHMLRDKTTVNSASSEFLGGLSQYQVLKILLNLIASMLNLSPRLTLFTRLLKKAMLEE